MSTTMRPPDAADKIMQQHRALREANRVKQARAAVLRRMYDRSQSESFWMAAELVEEVPDVLGSLLVADFLLRIRKVGPTAAERLLLAAGVGESVQMRALTPRQRAGLAGVLRWQALPGRRAL